MRFSLLTTLALAASANAAIIFVGSYGGQIHSVNLNDSTGALTLLSSTSASAPDPSWQETSPVAKDILYTVEERASGNYSLGAVTSYRIGSNGALTKLFSTTQMGGPVSMTVSPNGKMIVTASYVGGGVTAFTANPSTGSITFLKDFTYTLSAPGAVPERQEAPHPHQALFDATGKYVLVPDLGADLIRIYGVSGAQLTELQPVAVTPGTGPRHGMFWPKTGTPKYYYLVGEIVNSVLVYEVSYSSAGIALKLVQTISTLPTPTSGTPPSTTSAAPWTTPSAGEIAISPDGETIYVSNRNDKVFIATTGTDSVATYSTTDEGLLELLEIIDAKVSTPRHIAVDPKGKWFITEGQSSADMFVFKRDADGTVVDAPVASLAVAGGPVCVTWSRKT
ncbi:Lactonase, 7-bladed beta-propeller-domain-containing protein [Tricharina praecox]|uniref:Lactonase, 7-bladed beta-propeller-domain-containing protein n=1 Tax=Tricharina praecox TaxID=43433 RepID=UPI00221EE58B|nr:Lactonase, 7-bladed beta-propeller-domain-containing protein [Tricharina praecox]KAI5850734.1 Lactonase, 7-bladed beta-propeller-domain-containing protein [Tricharina praecox]